MKKSKNIISIYDKYANQYAAKSTMMDLYNDTYDELCKIIDKRHPAILEMGCGPGNVTKYLLAKRPDFNILGIDMAPAMIEIAKKNNPAVYYELMDCREVV